ncbi:MAG TPA: M20/M25/M40 family metallo-hydrolase [Pyrinomonadaceae bacterium]|nr:M20/M25/M40 family metallo-hydrolase [Pyrinomonadaceae bacterium]
MKYKWRDSALAAVMAATVLAAVGFGLLARPSAPAPLPATAPQKDFSAERALAHVREIARRPHPSGTRENAEVGDYIVRQIEALGLKPEIQQTSFASRNWANDHVLVQVRNIMARIEGTEADGGRALLFSAHYDSAPGSPGAGDDGAGVAVLLESMRALAGGDKLTHDIIFLFTDAEELGTYGAKAFVAEHPWSKEVAAAFNFEARGTTGAAIMFETGEEDGWLVREFLRAAPYANANSFAAVLYKLMSYGTDFGVFKQAGMSGLNFAFAEGLERYHTGRDSVEFLDPQSLQHEGGYALALARTLGNANFNERPRFTGTYFNLIGSLYIFYPTAWAGVFTLLPLVLYFVALFLARRRGLLRLRHAFLTAVLAIVAILFTTLTAGGLLVTISGGKGPGPLIYAGSYIYAALVLYSLAVFAVVMRFCLKRWSLLSVSLGALALWIVALVWITMFAPTAAYLFQWPGLLACLLAFGIILQGKGEIRTTPLVIGGIVAAFGMALVLAPPFDSLHVALPLPFWGALGMVLVLALTLFIPQFDAILRRVRWRLPAGALVVVAVCVVAAAMTRYDDTRPQPNHVFYIANADTRTAAWITRDEPDAWTKQFFPDPKLSQALREYLPDWYTGDTRGENRVTTNGANFVVNNPPEATVVSDETVDGVRHVQLRITSPQAAQSISVNVQTEGGILESAVGEKKTEQVAAAFMPARAETSDANADEKAGDANRNEANKGAAKEAGANSGKAAEEKKPQKAITFVYYGIPSTGTTLSFATKAGERVKVELIERIYDLPAANNQTPSARPPSMFQARSYIDATMVRRSFTF